jgi:pyruvate dehydrogenase E2 component (dihydrolipoamide acetyltransferase)
MSDDAVLKLFEEGSYELIPHDNMRKTIARRLVEAKSTVPHFYLTVDCELDALLGLRKQLNDVAPVRKTEKGEEPAYKLSVNDLIIKALALALKEVPDANVSWTEGAMVKHRHADVGVAVSIPGGLITPIVRRAEEKSLSSISNEMKDLAARDGDVGDAVDRPPGGGRGAGRRTDRRLQTPCRKPDGSGGLTTHADGALLR